MYFGALESSCTGVLAWLVKFVKFRCKQKGVFHVFLDKKLRFKIITETISAKPALDKTFAFTITKKTDWYRVVTILMCIMGERVKGNFL